MLGIRDDARLAGTDYEQFKKENKELADSTKTLVVYGRDITFLSICEVPEYQEEGATTFWILNDASLRDFRKYNTSPNLAKMYNKDYPDEAIKEIKNGTGLMLFCNDEKYIVSQMAMPTLSMQASVAGDMTINRSNLLRDMHLADAIFFKNAPLTLVYREIESDGIAVKKILAAFAGAYREVKQTVVSSIADAVMNDPTMGNAEVKYWDVNHEITSIELAYPKMHDEYDSKYGITDITPGVSVRTSDVGKSAITVFGTQRIRNSYVITEEISAKHTKKNEDPTKIVETVEEKIFYNHRKLPEMLALLIGKEAVDYSSMSASESYEALCDLVEDATTKLLKAVLSKRQLQSLLDALKVELDTGIHYTLYDIALCLMTLAERLKGLDDSTILYVRKALSKTPDVLNAVINEKAYLVA